MDTIVDMKLDNDRNSYQYLLRCISKFGLKSTHLGEGLEDIIHSISFDKDDITKLLTDMINSTSDAKLKEQLIKGRQNWLEVPENPTTIPIKPEDSPI